LTPGIYVLHDQVRGAVVDKSAALVGIGEQRSQLLDQLLLTIVLIDRSLVLLDDCKALVKDLLAVLSAHELAELG
jgi:hypothetical protein